MISYIQRVCRFLTKDDKSDKSAKRFYFNKLLFCENIRLLRHVFFDRIEMDFFEK